MHVQAPEQVAQREVLQVGLDGAGVQPRDVQHRVEGTLQALDRAHHVADQRLLLGALQPALEAGREQPQRMHRLAQVVARDGQEAALLLVGADGAVAVLLQRADVQVLFHQQALGALPAVMLQQRQAADHRRGQEPHRPGAGPGRRIEQPRHALRGR